MKKLALTDGRKRYNLKKLNWRSNCFHSFAMDSKTSRRVSVSLWNGTFED